MVGASISLVMIGHYARFHLQAVSGASLFFVVSGFLITRTLLRSAGNRFTSRTFSLARIKSRRSTAWSSRSRRTSGRCMTRLHYSNLHGRWPLRAVLSRLASCDLLLLHPDAHHAGKWGFDQGGLQPWRTLLHLSGTAVSRHSRHFFRRDLPN